MRRIGIMLSKGGVGKTTTAVNLAHGLAKKGRNVVVVDTDTQGQVSRSLHIEPDVGLFEVLQGDIPLREALYEAREGLYILSGGQSLFDWEYAMYTNGGADPTALREALGEFEQATGIDYVIIDSAPSWSLLTANVLFYVDELLIPVALENLSIDGLKQFIDRLAAVEARKRDETGESIQLSYVVPTRHDRRLKQSEEFLDQLSSYCGQVLTESIRNNVRVSECSNHGETIFEYAPDSYGAEDYTNLAQTVLSDE